MPIFTTLAAGAAIALRALGINAKPWGEVIYDTPGTYTFTVPEGVTSICAVCIGGGGGGYSTTAGGTGGSGGGLVWGNNMPVVPGAEYTVEVGAGGTGGTSPTNGGNSVFKVGTTAILTAIGGTGNTSDTVKNGGGRLYTAGYFSLVSGGNGGQARGGTYAGGGGGAGGYTGTGGNGGYSGVEPTAGNGGGAGGGGYGGSGDSAGGGGGTGLYGQGPNGIAGVNSTGDVTVRAGGGSYGEQGGTEASTSRPHGGKYGGGGGGTDTSTAPLAGNGGDGAVRIIWGEGRAFPTTNVGNLIFRPSLYVSSGSDSLVERYDLETAELLGSITFPDFVDISEAISFKDFIVVMGAGYMSFYNKYTMHRGNVLANPDFVQALCTDGDYIYAQLDSGYIRKYTISSTGLDLSLVATSALMITNSAQDASQIYYDNGYIYGADYNHHAWKVNASTLTREWINTTLGSGYARGCCKVGDYVYVNTDSNTMVKLNDSDGALVDTLTLPAVDAREIVTDGDYLYTSCSNGALVKIRLSDFTIVDSVIVGYVGSVAIALHEGVLYVAKSSSGIISTVDSVTMDIISASAYDSSYSGSVRAIVVDNCIDFRSA